MFTTQVITLRNDARSRVRLRSEAGAATAEYGVTILVGVAFALSVLAIITDGALNATVTGLLDSVLSKASAMAK